MRIILLVLEITEGPGEILTEDEMLAEYLGHAGEILGEIL